MCIHIYRHVIRIIIFICLHVYIYTYIHIGMAHLDLRPTNIFIKNEKGNEYAINEDLHSC
jgi:hypothetical protein